MTTPFSALASALSDRYRIERELGAGGMATVYLAQDLKHDRKVAIKVLRPELAAVIGAERFLSEIKTTANLQHPHILPLFDSGVADSFLFYVMPFIEGESLRDRLNREKQLPIGDAVRIATEIASALDYAHRHGVIHRDIKPENILLHDGRALVADFGIALAESKAGGSRMTETGMSLGTPTYMSPEQAMGEREITARSDVYALGCVTYEMLIGEPPFTGPTAQSIVAKVMTEKPASLIARRDRIPERVEEAVLTALEKLPADRFSTAAAFADALQGPDELPRHGSRAPARSSLPSGRPPRPWLLVAGALLLALGFLAGRWAIRRSTAADVTFTIKTFHEQAIFNARFAPDGKTIVYSAIAEGQSPELYIIRPDYPEATPMGLTDTHLLSISSKGQMAVLVHAVYVRHRLMRGTLAEVPLGGGAPREILEGVREADWSPDGTELAVIHETEARDRLEFPIGKVLYEGSGYLSDPRVSPDGKHVAFAEHPFRWDDRGTIRIVDRSGKSAVLASDFAAIEGLAWSRDGSELFFSGTSSTNQLQVFSVRLNGRLRAALAGPGDLTTQDISPTGEMLLTRDNQPYQMRLHGPGASGDLDVSWMDLSLTPRLSHDGALLAFSDGRGESGSNYALMLRKTSGGQPARLGEGWPGGFSPDGKWLLAMVSSTPPRLTLYPTGAGAEQAIDIGRFENVGSSDWFPDGKSVLFCGSRPTEASRCYVQSLGGGAPRGITPPGTRSGFVSPDGTEIVAFGSSLGHRRYPLAGGPGRAIPGLTDNDQVLGWSMDGKALYVGRPTTLAVERFDLATGGRREFLALSTEHTKGLTQILWFTMADDPHVYSYVASNYQSQLFVVDGLR